MISPTKLSYSESTCYGQFFRELDINNAGLLQRDLVARFFRRSGLPNAVLAEIWDICKPPNSDANFDRSSFYAGLRLIALAQHHKPLSLSINFGSVPVAYIEPPSATSAAAPSENPSSPSPLHEKSAPFLWGNTAITTEERTKYAVIFNEMNPLDGFLSRLQLKDFLREKFKVSENVCDSIIQQICFQDNRYYFDFDTFASIVHALEALIREHISTLSSDGKGLYASKDATPRISPTAEERRRYETLFSDYVRQHPSYPFVNYEESADILSSCVVGSINEAVMLWRLANDREDICLDCEEFITLMHVVKLWKEKDQVSIRALQEIKDRRLQARKIATAITSPDIFYGTSAQQQNPQRMNATGVVGSAAATSVRSKGPGDSPLLHELEHALEMRAKKTSALGSIGTGTVSLTENKQHVAPTRSFSDDRKKADMTAQGRHLYSSDTIEGTTYLDGKFRDNVSPSESRSTTGTYSLSSGSQSLKPKDATFSTGNQQEEATKLLCSLHSEAEILRGDIQKLEEKRRQKELGTSVQTTKESSSAYRDVVSSLEKCNRQIDGLQAEIEATFSLK